MERIRQSVVRMTVALCKCKGVVMQIPRVTSLGALASLTILGETAAQGGLSFAVSTFKNGLLGAAAFAAVSAGVNFASSATFTYNGYTVANEQNINILTPNTISGGAGQVTLIAGANSGQNLLAWCLDVYNSLAPSGTYTIAPLTTAGAGGSNPSLTTTQIGEIGALMKNGDLHIGASTDVSAATQLAIWKVEYGAAFAYTGLDAGAIALAATYLTDAAAGGTGWAPEGVNLFSEGGNQNLGDWTPLGGGGSNPTPLPAALPLFATGLGALGLLGWRRK